MDLTLILNIHEVDEALEIALSSAYTELQELSEIGIMMDHFCQFLIDIK